MFSSTMNWLTRRLGWIHPHGQLIVFLEFLFFIIFFLEAPTRKMKGYNTIQYNFHVPAHGDTNCPPFPSALAPIVRERAQNEKLCFWQVFLGVPTVKFGVPDFPYSSQPTNMYIASFVPYKTSEQTQN